MVDGVMPSAFGRYAVLIHFFDHLSTAVGTEKRGFWAFEIVVKRVRSSEDGSKQSWGEKRRLRSWQIDRFLGLSGEASMPLG